MEGGFIKICRKLLSWEWYTEANTMRVFIHCLLMANWKDGRYRGYEVPRGSFVTGRKKLSKELKISEQSIRTALSHLELTNELTIKKYTKFSIITVVKYDEYQAINQQTNQELTNNQPTTNQQLTTIEEYKNKKNGKKGRYMPTQGELLEVPVEELEKIENLYLEGVRNDKS